jgi:retron-type reverse transcriptase
VVYSLFLINVVSDEPDRELERRGHRFVRYAGDGNVYECRLQPANA